MGIWNVTRLLQLILGFIASSLTTFGFTKGLATDLPAEQLQFFENEVRPLLVEHCLECHSESDQQGGLRLDSRQGLLQGGESGPAITQDGWQMSLLLQAVRHESLEMPPSGKLRDEQIEVLEKWVRAGAPWPEHDGAQRIDWSGGKHGAEKIGDEDRQWWAYQPLQEVAVPQVADPMWDTEPIDAFLYYAMAKEGLEPAGPAEPEALLRRVYFDLVGLPPTPQEVTNFLRDPSDTAYRSIVEQLLNDQRYGERWAQHWLDLVRYADSDGYRIDHYRPTAWRYRDYVVRAFNEDKPYDQFVKEQIAGDELFPQSLDAHIATGYLRHWIYEYNQRDVRTQWSFIVDDITDTTGDVFLGMGMQCAKCHDHKFDPILQEDYYRLRAYFAAVLPVDKAIVNDDQWEIQLKQWDAWLAATASLREAIDTIEAPYRDRAQGVAVGRFPPDLQEILRKDETERTPLEKQLASLAYRQILFEFERLESMLSKEDKERVLTLKKDLQAYDNLRPAPVPAALAVSDVSDQAPPTIIPKRKDFSVSPGSPYVLANVTKAEERIPSVGSTGRRAALAQWLASADNPLTTRTIVNRIWQYHFGRGLAPNSSDFGKLGGSPSHPDLLDWLTADFIRNGWSIKHVHRQIVTSAAYRQSTRHPRFAEYQRIDPLNRYYWRADTKRLDASQIRDALLAVSGQLNSQFGGEGVLGDQARRSVYLRLMRNARDPFLDQFDLPQFFNSESSRNTTTTPVQSLMLINSPEMLRFAQVLAQRITQGSSQLEEQIDRLWLLAYNRLPLERERATALGYLQQISSLAAAESTASSQAAASLTEVEEMAQVRTGRMLYREGQALNMQSSTNSDSAATLLPQTRVLPMGALQTWTYECYFQVRSVYDSGEVRTLVSQIDQGNGRGWSLGVTGKGSRRKPQTLVLQMWGDKNNGEQGEEVVFSDHSLKLETPYYLAVSVELGASGNAGNRPGQVEFHLKDLSNDDEPLLSVSLQHNLIGALTVEGPLVLGGRANSEQHRFDGLLDDCRLTLATVPQEMRLMTTHLTPEKTVGHWRFEPEPGLLRDASPLGNRLHIKSEHNKPLRSPLETAMIDLCHAVLNSNEFLYVH